MTAQTTEHRLHQLLLDLQGYAYVRISHLGDDARLLVRECAKELAAKPHGRKR